jgi:hypothetical protein
MDVKEKARVAFLMGKFRLAATLCTNAFNNGNGESQLEIAKVLSNRALSFLELGEPPFTMRDADAAIALCPEW